MDDDSDVRAPRGGDSVKAARRGVSSAQWLMGVRGIGPRQGMAQARGRWERRAGEAEKDKRARGRKQASAGWAEGVRGREGRPGRLRFFSFFSFYFFPFFLNLFSIIF